MSMVIDVHVHPGFYEKISGDKEELEFRKKTGALGSDVPISGRTYKNTDEICAGR